MSTRGVTVAPGQRVLRFADTSLMSVELGLPDRLIGRLDSRQGGAVEVSGLEGMPPFKAAFRKSAWRRAAKAGCFAS